MSVKASMLFVLLIFAQSAFAIDPIEAYYGQEFHEAKRTGQRDEALLNIVRKVIALKHVRSKDGMDVITETCDIAQRNCFQHRSIGYNTARSAILGNLHLAQHGKDYAIEEVYCQRDYTKDDFNKAPFPGPDVIPNHGVVNVEHTWPQSKFNRRFDSGMQKSDLHHLFPTDSEMNSIRGNFNFGDVQTEDRELKCSSSKFGFINGVDGHFFEPPQSHKGNVARALFYFSVRYMIPINAIEEEALKRWHKQDPVDQAERDRNDRIQQIQGNRNPFIDYPELADSVANF